MNLQTTLWLLVAMLAAAYGPAMPVRAEEVFGGGGDLRFPDGSVAASWEKPAVPTRTYYVDQRHPLASDGNDGTAERPLRTIGRAAEMVEAGERVLVKAGVYREHVRPRHGGAGPEAMVSFEAEPGAAVILRGSCVLPRNWARTATSPAAAGAIWTLRLPEDQFAKYNPFAHGNLDERDGHTHQWETAADSAKIAANARRRGLLFQDGQRLRQVGRHEELAGEEGTYWIDADGWVLHAHLFGAADPNTVLMEATNQRQCFAPETPGGSYVRLKGFTIEQVGNAFSYPVAAAVSPMGGHHWIIEDNVIRNVNADAVNIGGYVWVWGGDRASQAGWHCIVRRNTITDCGVSGIKGLTPVRCIVEGNIIERIAWQDVELGYDNGGMKLLVCRDTIVRRNLIRDVTGGPGIWLDWDNINCRVTQNVVTNLRSGAGGIFIEASQQTNWADHNVVWGVQGNGIYQHDSDRLVVFNNLIGQCTDAAIRMQVCTQRQLNGRAVTCRGNEVRDNVIIDCGSIAVFMDPENHCDRNIVADSKRPDALALWQKASGKDGNSRQMPIQATLDPSTLELRWTAPEEPAAEPKHLAGPFTQAVLRRGNIRLFELPAPR